MSEEFLQFTCYCIAHGLNDMHKKEVLHRDVKPENVLCSTDGRVKVSDLGISVFLCEQQAYRKTRIGT